MTAPVPLTQAIGEFVAGVNFRALPREIVPLVCNGITDCAGVTILGRDEPVTRIAASILVRQGTKAEARLLFGNDRAGAPEAALVNATAGHAFDFDDTGIGAHPAHPSVVIASAILAAGEPLGASGEEMLAAYVAGYDVWGQLARRDAEPHNVAGWHPSSVFGPLAAAAAVANLMRLTAAEAAHAVGIAASRAGGLIGNFGSMAKPLHVGWAAQAGIEAARLAKAGLTAAPDIIEKSGGFLTSFSPNGKVDLESAPIFGKEWWVLRHGPNIKLYPVCYSIYGAIDAMLDLCKAQRLAAGDICGIEVDLTPSQAANLYDHDARNVAGAKFSAEFAMAMAVVAGRASMSELTQPFVERAEVRSLMKKVKTKVVGADAAGKLAARSLRVVLTGGMEHRQPIGNPRGHSSNPPTQEDLWSKFAECASSALPQVEARALFDRLQRFDRLANILEIPAIASLPSPVASGISLRAS